MTSFAPVLKLVNLEETDFQISGKMSNQRRGSIVSPPPPPDSILGSPDIGKPDEDSSASSSAGGDPKVDQLREQSDKRQLLLDHLELIRKEAACVRESSKIFLRRHLQQLRERIQNGRENGVDPLSIFPEEVWSMIFEYLTAPKDLDNCTKACQLFQNILKDTKLERLFGKTFPLVYKYLPGVKRGFTDDIKNCRLVCKQWRSQVDSFLESDVNTHTKYTSNTGNLGHLKEEPNPLFGAAPFMVGHSFGFQLTPGSFRSRRFIPNTVRERMRLHPGNPFVGRKVLVEAMIPDFEDQPNFNGELGKLLDDFGQHVHNLELSSEDGFVFETPDDYYFSVIQSLTKCPNLKTLRPYNFNMYGVADENVDLNSEQLELELPDHDSLESLIIRPAPRDHVWALQDKLIERYSGQLKYLYVVNWHGCHYHLFPWNNLRRLYIHSVLRSGAFDSLMRTSAPNLQHLDIGVKSDGSGLKELLELVGHFPNLNHLELKIFPGGDAPDNKLFHTDEILSISPGLVRSTASLTTLTIWVRPGMDISYDFLICFPFLKRLVFIHEWRSEWEPVLEDENLENSDNDEREDSEEKIEIESGAEGDDEDDEEDESANAKGETTCRLVKLAEYLWKKPGDKEVIEKIYRSNVWEMLPSLETVETVVQLVPEIGGRENIVRMAHTRQGYDLRKDADFVGEDN